MCMQKSSIFPNILHKKLFAPFLNESCYKCKMDNVFKADIRLSDFWGYSSFEIPKDEKGMSLLFVQTQKRRRNC